jgi:Sulfatase
MAWARHRGGQARDTPRFNLIQSGLHLAVLSSFALAWKYFDPLRETPDFFVSRGLGGREIVLYAVSVLVLPPALLVGVEWLAGLASARLRDGLHLVFIGGFFALIAWQAANDILTPPPPSAAVIQLGALTVAIVATWAYRQRVAFRWWLSALAPIPLVVLVLFLVFSPLRPIVFGGGGPTPEPVSSTRAPVVVIVFDELPVVSLMGPDRRMDAVRYPHFARLASTATWYRGAASTADYTALAVPTILTGKRGEPDEVQVAPDHPHSLFTLLGGSYHLDVSEWATHLCEAACPEQSEAPLSIRLRRLYSDSIGAIPAIPSWAREPVARRLRPSKTDSPQVATYRRSVRRLERGPEDVRFRHFLQILGRGPAATLYFLHVGLPHRPFSGLPDGHRYRPALDTDFYERWAPDAAFADEAYRRHLLQVGYTDRLLGALLRRLADTRLLDRALVVVTADHGASFRPGDQSRNVTSTNAGEVSGVPLIIKYPGQRRGQVSDARVETTDILPTIAKALRVRVPWPVDGRPADDVGNSRGRLVIWRVDAGGKVAVGWRTFRRQEDAALRRKLELFGWGRSRPGLFGGGPSSGLIGRHLSALRLVPREGVRASLTDPSQFRSVTRSDRFLPADVSGRLLGRRVSHRVIVVAVNGRVVATTWSDPGTGGFATVVPPASLRNGANDVEILTPVRTEHGPALAVLGGARSGPA